MSRPGMMELTGRMAKKGWIPKKDFHPGGHKGKLHRELGVPEDEKIPEDRLSAAMHSKNPEVRRDAIRANTMKHWKKPGHKHPSRREALYGRGESHG